MAGGRRAKAEAANQCQAPGRDDFPCVCVCVCELRKRYIEVS